MKGTTLFFLLAFCAIAAECGLRKPVFLGWKDGVMPAREAAQIPTAQELWFSQTLDHFNFASQPATYQQRYLISDTYWNPNKAKSPIFFYTGNEGDIWMFYNNTGFLFELAQEFGALVVFAEHRYYGQSLPFGSHSLSPKNLQYCTAEQALADFATLLTSLKANTKGLQDSPIISFGGSYGGMLTAWFRQKYPHIVTGGLASSAPVAQFPGLTGDYEFYKIVTADYSAVSPTCSARVRQAFSTIFSLGSSSSGYNQLSNSFRLCTPIKNSGDVDNLVNFVNTALTYMAMTDYPYPTNFLQPMPAWPVTAACQPIIARGATDLLGSLADAIGVYYNYTGSQRCFSLTQPVSPGLGDAWNYQACTEMTLNTASNGISDMFYSAPFSLPALIQSCQQQYDVTPRVDWIPLYFAGRNVSAMTNIIFSNGQLDPWYGGGVLTAPSPSVTTIFISQSAHHLDLRFSNPADPPSVVQARAQEKALIAKWISQN